MVNPKDPFDLTVLLQEYLSTGTNQREPSFGGSNSGYCALRLQRNLLGHGKPQGMDKLSFLEDGFIHEAQIIKKLQKAGYVVLGNNEDMPIVFNDGATSLAFTVHPDGLIRHPLSDKTYILECKAVKPVAYEIYQDGLPKDWISQGHVYLHAAMQKYPELKFGGIIYAVKNRESSAVFFNSSEYEPSHHDKIMGDIATRFIAVYMAIQNNLTVEKSYEEPEKECAFCDYKFTCWGISFDPRSVLAKTVRHNRKGVRGKAKVSARKMLDLWQQAQNETPSS